MSGAKCSAINAYARTVDMEQRRVVHLKGGTAVQAFLDITQRYKAPDETYAFQMTRTPIPLSIAGYECQ